LPQRHAKAVQADDSYRVRAADGWRAGNAGAQLLLKAGTNERRDHSRAMAGPHWCAWRPRPFPPRRGVLRCRCPSGSYLARAGVGRHPLSVGYIVNAIAAHYLFGEAVTATRWVGIGFIVVGVFLVARSSGG
jgi:hypothetical protein